jgi:hypothetical protein
MIDIKHPLKSLGIMGPLVAIIIAVANAIKPGLGLTDAQVAPVIDQVDLFIGLAIGIYARWRATTVISTAAPISKPDPSKVAALLMLVSLTMLSACATTGQGVPQATAAQLNDPAYQLLVTCRAWDTTLRSLAGYRAQGKLSKEDVATVEQWRPVLNQSCQSNQADIPAALNAAEQALQQIVIVEQAAAK